MVIGADMEGRRVVIRYFNASSGIAASCVYWSCTFLWMSSWMMSSLSLIVFLDFFDMMIHKPDIVKLERELPLVWNFVLDISSHIQLG
jgi:hypothetical protein